MNEIPIEVLETRLGELRMLLNEKLRKIESLLFAADNEIGAAVASVTAYGSIKAGIAALQNYPETHNK